MGKKAKLKKIRKIADKLPQMETVNHNRRMKALYNKMGAAGVGAYVQAVKAYVDRATQKTA